MMVDDDQAILNMFNRILDFEGYNAPETADGKAVLSLLEECKPNLVILDITMPDLDSLQTRSLMQRDYSTPVIMLTAKCEVTTLQDARLLRGDSEEKEPLRQQALLARIVARLRGALAGQFRRN